MSTWRHYTHEETVWFKKNDLGEEQTGDLKITYIGNKDDNGVQSFFIQSYGLISIPLKSNVPNVMIQNQNLAF